MSVHTSKHYGHGHLRFSPVPKSPQYVTMPDIPSVRYPWHSWPNPTCLPPRAGRGRQVSTVGDWLLDSWVLPIPSMGLVYLPTWIVDFYGKLVGKYTSPMDGMGWSKPRGLSAVYRGMKYYPGLYGDSWSLRINEYNIMECHVRGCVAAAFLKISLPGKLENSNSLNCTFFVKINGEGRWFKSFLGDPPIFREGSLPFFQATVAGSSKVSSWWTSLIVIPGNLLS